MIRPHAVWLVVFLAAYTQNAAGQARDNWLWPSVQVEKKFFGDLILSVNAEGRINSNYTNLRGYFGEFEAKWEFNKYLAVSGNYRIGGRQADISDYAKGQRVSLFVYGKLRFDKFSITNRAGIFRQYLEIRETPRDYFRNKLTIKGDFLKKVNPMIYAEYFHRFDTEPAKIDEWRLAGGAEWDITKKHSLKLLYIYCQQVNVKNPDGRDVIALTYTLKLKSLKKKAKEEEPDEG
jgi:opacity protein-like surface antigen